MLSLCSSERLCSPKRLAAETALTHALTTASSLYVSRVVSALLRLVCWASTVIQGSMRASHLCVHANL